MFKAEAFSELQVLFCDEVIHTHLLPLNPDWSTSVEVSSILQGGTEGP